MKLLIVDTQASEERIRKIFLNEDYESNNLLFVNSVEDAKDFIANQLIRDRAHIDAIITNNVEGNSELANAHHIVRFLNHSIESYSNQNFRVSSIPVVLHSEAEDKSDLQNLGFNAIVKSNGLCSHRNLVDVVEDQIKKWRESFIEDLDRLELDLSVESFFKNDSEKRRYVQRFGKNYPDSFSKTNVLSMQFIRFPKTLDYDWITISDEMLESTLTVFRTTFRANIKYDRRQNERTIIHQLFLRNPSLLHRDSYADHKYELSLKEKQDNCRQNCDFILMPDLPSHQNTTFFEVKKENVKMMVKMNKKRPRFSSEMHDHLYQISDYRKYTTKPENAAELAVKMGYLPERNSFQLLVGRLDEKLEAKDIFREKLGDHFPGIEVVTYEELESLYIGYINKLGRLRVN
ncbi:MAG TPA: Shedu anti-phage system protein SduA domain-containing protein [Anseongella sp.]